MALAATAAITGCLSDPVMPVDPPDFAPSLEINLDEMTLLPSGVYIKDLTVGGGPEATDTSTIRVHYSGWLKNGQLFGTSRGSNPLEFTLGNEEMIEGWEYGLPGMKEGGKRKLIIPPNLAYGSRGNGPIHPNATLVFEVELLEVKGASSE